MFFSTSLLAVVPFAFSFVSAQVNTTICNGKTYAYEELAGYGLIASNATDKFRDTIGGIGSAIAIDRLSWQRIGDSYTGLLYAIPDRGWNTQGTLNYQNRVQKFTVSFTPTMFS